MKPLVSIIMGSTSDLPIMEKACKWLEQYEIPFEVNALSAHRTPAAVEKFAKEAKERGIKVIIAGAGMAAALPGVIAASTSLPRNRRAYQRYVRRFRCHAFHHSDASWHTCCDGRRKRCTERSDISS